MKPGEQWQFGTDEHNDTYTVKAASERYAILTAPYPEENTLWYTIVDLVERVRGPNNQVFNCYEYSKQEDIEQCLLDLEAGVVSISRRYRVPLTTNCRKIE